jgi:hypothetical protein
MRLGLPFALALGVACAEPESDCLRDPPLTYDNFGEGFVEQFCAGCHSSLTPEVHRNGAPAGVDFDHYGAVLSWAERIEARVLEPEPARAMPPGGGPTEEERERLSEWVRCSVLPDRARLEEEEE